MKNIIKSIWLVGIIILLSIGFLSCSFTLSENEYAVLTFFGKVVGSPVKTSGLHFKWPLVTVNRLDGRIHEWDGQAVSMPTRDKLYMIVDSYGRWRIADPLLYFTRLRDTRSALSRMEDIIGSENRDNVAQNDLIEIVRTDKARKPVIDTSIVSTLTDTNVSPLLPIKNGRTAVEDSITKAAAEKLAEFGLQLIDVRFMRINYSTSVTTGINNRMISERKKIADKFKSEGEGEAANIRGEKERDLKQISSTAYETAQQIKGEADALATKIYAEAYNQSPDSLNFYGFIKTLDAYRKVANKDTTLVLTTDNGFFKFLQEAETKH